MAARVIPFEDRDTAQNISITDTDASPAGYILTATQNSVTFTNNASSPVSISFNPTGILTNISDLAVGSTSAANREIADVCENACRIKSDADRRAGIIGESHAVLRRREDVTRGTGVGIGDADVLSGITIFKRNDACGHGWLLFELNSLTFRWAENWDPRAILGDPEYASGPQGHSLSAGSFRYTVTPECDRPGFRMLGRRFPGRSD